MWETRVNNIQRIQIATPVHSKKRDFVFNTNDTAETIAIFMVMKILFIESLR